MLTGALGGLRGLGPVSQMLNYVGVHVVANQVRTHALPPSLLS